MINSTLMDALALDDNLLLDLWRAVSRTWREGETVRIGWKATQKDDDWFGLEMMMWSSKLMEG